ncbi:MAG: asparagine--tRNA ligase [Clostridiales bacterium]|nr:asparagine--tRNA ligase [Clostridiales bacterium]
MGRIYIKSLYSDMQAYSAKKIKICGWVKTLRDSKSFGFIELNDGSYFKNCQVVFSRDKIDNYDEVAHQNVGASLEIEGEVLLTPEMRQPFEIHAEKVTVLGESTPDYPLQKKRHSVEFLREIAHLRPRTNLFSAVFRIRSEAAFAIHTYFNQNGFVYVHTPIITGSDCEGAGAMFQVTTLDLGEKPDYKNDFFGKKASLTVSGQLNVETYAMAFANVYTFGPTFRAEKSNTARHAAEFWMIEPEMAFCDLAGDMDVAEGMVKHVISHVMNTCKPELEFLNNFVDKGLLERLNLVKDSDFVRLTYTKAIEILEEAKANGVQFEFPVYWGCDLQSEHERYITEQVYKKPVFLTDYPKEIKAFYMRLNDDNKTVAAADLLVPGIGELVGGSQREERMEVLLKRMQECGLNAEDYEFYTDLRKYGGCVHSGFGLGFERMIMYLTGVANIRDVIPFPRTVGNCNY